MAKKSFKDNPALSFISAAVVEEETENKAAVPASTHTDTAQGATNAFNGIEPPTAVEFIAPAAEKPAPIPVETAPAPTRSAPPRKSSPTQKVITSTSQDIFPPASRESKSKRLQLLIRPSTHQAIAGVAQAHQTSINDTINLILEDYLRRQP